MTTEEGDGWSQYQRLIIHRLDTMDERIEKLEAIVVLVQIELAQRKVKAGLWGGVIGALTGVASAIVTAIA